MSIWGRSLEQITVLSARDFQACPWHRAARVPSYPRRPLPAPRIHSGTVPLSRAFPRLPLTPQKSNIELLWVIPLVGIWPRELKTGTNIFMQMLTAATFTRVTRWQQAQCPSADGVK